MTEIDKEPDPCSSTARSDLFSSHFSFTMDCSPFLNWSEEELVSNREKAIVFRSLAATLKIQPALDVSVEAKAVAFLESVDPQHAEAADDFLGSLASSSDDYSTNFVQCIVILISSPSQVITTATMKMMDNLFFWCSPNIRLALVKADLLPQLITTLNPQSLSFTEAVDIHINLMNVVTFFLWLAAPKGLEDLKIQDDNKQRAVSEAVFQQVLAPSEQYIGLLCINRYSIIDGELSRLFLALLAQILRISPYHQATMEFVLNLPVLLTIPSCLTLFEHELSIWNFLYIVNHLQREWNKTRVEIRQMGKIALRMLRQEGIEDVMEEKLQHHNTASYGEWIVVRSIEWNNLQGINLPKQE
ncbi:hypothetical protein BLNAU_11097 [Blattamonas nauphoetae]|uniref:Uncharacterized protein n=1 Tax=Blattamonas nauphoetae TaxID=2049346 RepID=A0ABQ9XSV8_9EUKA|nr:hypothetical protein BLNAU_11097 [Blattamonas nauphoetae]